MNFPPTIENPMDILRSVQREMSQFQRDTMEGKTVPMQRGQEDAHTRPDAGTGTNLNVRGGRPSPNIPMQGAGKMELPPHTFSSPAPNETAPTYQPPLKIEVEIITYYDYFNAFLFFGSAGGYPDGGPPPDYYTTYVRSFNTGGYTQADGGALVAPATDANWGVDIPFGDVSGVAISTTKTGTLTTDVADLKAAGTVLSSSSPTTTMVYPDGWNTTAEGSPVSGLSTLLGVDSTNNSLVVTNSFSETTSVDTAGTLQWFKFRIRNTGNPRDCELRFNILEMSGDKATTYSTTGHTISVDGSWSSYFEVYQPTTGRVQSLQDVTLKVLDI